MPETIKDRIDFLWNVHGYTNDYIRFADSKAAFVATAVTGLIAALVASHVFDALNRLPISAWPARSWLGFSALLLLVVALVFAVVAIRPRLHSSVPKGLIYWKSVVRHGNDTTFAAHIKTITPSAVEVNLSRHVFELARICSRKYFWANLSLLIGLAGGIEAGAAILLSHLNQ
ncbi:MAG: Pycsar system effector family protein [Terracidiphilus sp.]